MATKTAHPDYPSAHLKVEETDRNLDIVGGLSMPSSRREIRRMPRIRFVPNANGIGFVPLCSKPGYEPNGSSPDKDLTTLMHKDRDVEIPELDSALLSTSSSDDEWLSQGSIEIDELDNDGSSRWCTESEDEESDYSFDSDDEEDGESDSMGSDESEEDSSSETDSSSCAMSEEDSPLNMDVSSDEDSYFGGSNNLGNWDSTSYEDKMGSINLQNKMLRAHQERMSKATPADSQASSKAAMIESALGRGISGTCNQLITPVTGVARSPASRAIAEGFFASAIPRSFGALRMSDGYSTAASRFKPITKRTLPRSPLGEGA
ncbi:hypothetical protein DFP72DRAFT_849885 [Ephemerocybe angulata]|uniref:Uncharacterized protein n=1 Tax=Ephemerocybe angulata TaxID=980116 RepID=A0A8H6HTA6_9AGAR|nr:hypothetical protein DFP72DRAFT_849885 [Tulosesus angulatus]